MTEDRSGTAGSSGRSLHGSGYTTRYVRFFEGVFSTWKALALSSRFCFLAAAPIFLLPKVRNTKLEAAGVESD